MGEISVQFMSHQKVKEYFSWTPTIDLNSGLNLSIEWYKKYLKQGQK